MRISKTRRRTALRMMTRRIDTSIQEGNIVGGLTNLVRLEIFNRKAKNEMSG